MSSNASLETLLADTVASDYESANADRHTSRVIQVLAIISAATLAIVFSAAIVTNNQQSNQNESVRQALISRIKLASQRVALSEADVVNSQQDLTDAQSSIYAGTDLGQQTLARLKMLRTISGFTPLTGGGVEVFLQDATTTNDVASGITGPGKVQDSDIQQVVNGLWQAGATGIAINRSRLTANTAIRNAGDAILVNYRPLVPPYRIVAVSRNADSTAGIFRVGVAGLLLEELASKYGVVWNLTMLGQTTIPAAPDVNGK